MSTKIRLSRPIRAGSAPLPSWSRPASPAFSPPSEAASSADLAAEIERKERFGHSLENLKTGEERPQEPALEPGSAAPVQFGGRGKKGKDRDRDSKGEKSKRKKDWQERRDRKQIGKSAGPLDVVAESRTKLPLQRDEVQGLAPEGTINPHRIRTIQSTATDQFSDETPVMETVKGLKKGTAQVPPIEIMRRKGKAFTLDNRRLYAHRRANVPVSYKLVDSGRKEEDFSRKFSTQDQGMSMKIVPSSTSKVPYAPEDLYPDSEEDLPGSEVSDHDEEELYPDSEDDFGSEHYGSDEDDFF